MDYLLVLAFYCLAAIANYEVIQPYKKRKYRSFGTGLTKTSIHLINVRIL